MKITKTLIAVAIAGIAATPMMASATTTISGVVQMKFQGNDDGKTCPSDAVADDDGVITSAADATVDTSGCATNANGDILDASDAQIAAGDVQIGVAASQALNSGLTGYGSLRLDLDNHSGNPVNGDSVYLGVKGGFGDVRIGEVPNAGEFGQAVDILDDMGSDVNQGISYTGSFGGATVGLSYSPVPDQDNLGVGAKFAWNGLSLGVGMENEDEKTDISAKAGFAYAGASITLDFHQREGAATETTTTTDAAGVETTSTKAIDETAIGVNVGYSIAGVGLGLTFQSQTESGDSKIRLDASYALGGGMTVSTRINSTTSDSGDTSDWRLQLAKSF